MDDIVENYSGDGGIKKAKKASGAKPFRRSQKFHVETDGEQMPAVLCSLSTPNAKGFSIVVQEDGTDGITTAILGNTFTLPEHYCMLFDLVRPNGKVLDLGAHIGTFSLMAAANGYQITAVEASTRNAALMRESIHRNGFNNIQLVQAAISDRTGQMEFIQDGPYGMVSNPGQPLDKRTITVPAITVDALLDQVNWPNVDMIKMDIEGSEVNAIKGMARLLTRKDAPPILFESNGHTLHIFGVTPGSLFSALEAYGYQCYHLYDGKLFPISGKDMQLECVADCVAFKDIPKSITKNWKIAPAMPLEEKTVMALGSLTHPNADVRAYVGRTLEQADETFLGDIRISSDLDDLEHDPVEAVRSAVAWWPERKVQAYAPIVTPAPVAAAPISLTENKRFTFQPIGLPDGRSVELALPAGSSDPVVQSYARNVYLNQFLVDLLMRFSQPGAQVLDLGCHVGTFAVPAAALGRNVLAVDASPLHIEAVWMAAERNHLDTLRVEWCAISDKTGLIEFNENGLWGAVALDGETVPGRLKVPARRGDEIVRNAGWSRIDFAKMDIEGSELAAIESLGAFMQGPDAPVVVYESNGMTFNIFGYTIEKIRRRLESLGYVTCRIEGNDLVYCPPKELQPEAWLDLVALPPAWQRKTAPIVSTWPSDDIVKRCIEWGTNEASNVREYLHNAFETDVDYPREDQRILALRRNLAAEFDRK
jgi:FkbM family methyltransferase